VPIGSNICICHEISDFEEWRGVHVFNANLLSRMFLTSACNSHHSCPLLQSAASFTFRYMFLAICALMFCMSPYMSGVDHTCAAIPCALGKVHCHWLGFELSSLPELSFSLSSDCCLSTCTAAQPYPPPGLPKLLHWSCWVFRQKPSGVTPETI